MVATMPFLKSSPIKKVTERPRADASSSTVIEPTIWMTFFSIFSYFTLFWCFWQERAGWGAIFGKICESLKKCGIMRWHSPVAQWWSKKLLTSRLPVRVWPGEPFFYVKNFKNYSLALRERVWPGEP